MRYADRDSDRWAEEVGDRRWSWEGMLPYFKKVERFVPSKEMGIEKREDVHGYEGPITVLPHDCSFHP
jgi:choline dehydrogenase-like flavoprotein